MKGSETRMTSFMEGADKRYVIPVYQRKYDWKQENCRQLYELAAVLLFPVVFSLIDRDHIPFVRTFHE